MLRAQWRKAVRAGTVATIAVASMGYAQTPQPEAAVVPGGLTAEELAAEPVPATDATGVTIAPVPEFGYFDEQGRYVLDLIEEEYTYIAIRIETADGEPVEGVEPVFSIQGTSELLEPADVSMQATTNQYGIVEFAVVGGEMGMDRIAIEYGDASTEVFVNVISQRATLYSMPEVGEGYLPWDDLLQAQVSFDDMTLFAEFPETVTQRSGETVKMAGFMMPLEAGVEQRWFLLTSHPPSCFFHVPGGPAGAVEVFAEEGIEVSWNPIVLEGRFEALEKSNSAVYRLSDARIVAQ